MKNLIVVVVMVLCSVGKAQSTYFNKYKPIADSFEISYGIPSSVMLAVAWFETGGGNTRTSRLLNNHFGITGPNNLRKTHGIKTMYKWFPSDTAGYKGFCDLVAKKSFYPTLKGNSDYRKWVSAIARSGYSGNASLWTSKVTWIIRNYRLD